jgi:hypothetical protein
MATSSEPFLLSSKGSTRASAYVFGNKVITLEGKTHVLWLDAISTVCGRTFDHATETWSEKVELFEGCDNHTNPSLALDADGHLHLAYGPHGWWGNWNSGCFKHVVSEKPNSIESWKDEVSFGYNATYACLITTPSGLDCIAYRGGDPPSPLMFQKQRPQGGWAPAQPIMHQDIAPQYTNVGATIVSDQEGTLYIAGHFYNLKTDARSTGVGALKSTDMGESWTNLAGESCDTPVLLNESVAVPHHGDGDIRLGGLALDASGSLWISSGNKGYGQLSNWTGESWRTIDLCAFLPEDRTADAGAIAIDTTGRIHMTVGLNIPVPQEESWGHGAQEVFHLVSDDAGNSFECTQISPSNEALPNWLPSISQGGIHQPIEHPVIVYTHGEKGVGCSPDTETDVYCVFID